MVVDNIRLLIFGTHIIRLRPRRAFYDVQFNHHPLRRYRFSSVLTGNGVFFEDRLGCVSADSAKHDCTYNFNFGWDTIYDRHCFDSRHFELLRQLGSKTLQYMHACLTTMHVGCLVALKLEYTDICN